MLPERARRYGHCVGPGVYYRPRSCTVSICVDCSGGDQTTSYHADIRVALRVAERAVAYYLSKSNSTYREIRAIVFKLDCPGCNPPNYSLH